MVAATTSAEDRFVTLFELFGKQPLANRLLLRFLGTTAGKGRFVTSMELGKWPPPNTRIKREKEGKKKGRERMKQNTEKK